MPGGTFDDPIPITSKLKVHLQADTGAAGSKSTFRDHANAGTVKTTSE